MKKQKLFFQHPDLYVRQCAQMGVNMKKIIALITGFSPLLIGYGLNQFITGSANTRLDTLLNTISIIFLLYWGWLGFLFCRLLHSNLISAVLCNLPAFITLVMILIQELVNKQYWSNPLGLATQFFYLPLMSLTFRITPYFHYLWQSVCISFFLMAAVFYLGGIIRKKIPERKVQTYNEN